ncbi:hypothetical protein C1645_743560 [Glomus cerebriforme]|uniref:Endonuclease/exonuclease/phosphatase n=1 Tax=Glomus cerebriforme TaxID=658196 RepID=A0A397S8V8_9GLOM|nr:hypothetical protein C1645_743560 [Glomus cerebriforme]
MDSNTTSNANLDKRTTIKKLTNIHSSPIEDFIKIGVINIHGGFNSKLDGILDFFDKENFFLLGLVETGLHGNLNASTNKYIPINRTKTKYYIYHDDSDVIAFHNQTPKPTWPINDTSPPNRRIDLIFANKTLTEHSLGNTSEETPCTADTYQDLPPEWADIYTPKPHIQTDWFNRKMDPITLTELQDTMLSLPNNKASGPSGIIYEDIKHLDTHTKQFLVDFFNIILTHHIYPKEWNDALLFPIPKPKDWNCQINNTRPIILTQQPSQPFRTLYDRTNNPYQAHNRTF